MKSLINRLRTTALVSLVIAGFTVAAHAQVTANWLNTVPGDEWNTASEWDQTIVPGIGTNVVIGSGTSVNYNNVMASPSIGTMALTGNLTVNNSGFNIDGGSTNPVANSLAAASILNITSLGSVSVANVSNATALTVTATGSITNNGTLQFNNSGAITLANGASPGIALTINPGSTFTMANTLGSFGINVGSGSSSSQGALLFMSNATVTLDKLLTVQGTASAVIINGGGIVNFNGGCRLNETANDNNQRIAITGATNVNLGNVSVYRCSFSSGGLLISNSVVNATGIQIGTGTSKAFGIAAAGSTLTNAGTFTISDNTNAASGSTDRRSQFLIRGSSTVVSTGPNGIILGNQSNTNPAVGIANTDIGGVLDMSSGTLIAQGITLIKDTTISNAYARLNLSGGTAYLGSIGLVANTGVAHTAFNVAFSGGALAATADWSSSAPMSITNLVKLQAADASGAPHNISLSGVLNGPGTLNKIGNGILTLNAAETYTGSTVVSAGTLTLGASGSILNSPAIVVGSGASVDATALANGLPINSAKTLQGSGSVLGTVNLASGGIINPGSNDVTGTLTIGNLVANGGAIYNYFTNSGPNPDLLVLTGDLDLTNVNTIQINGTVTANTAYPLIQYGGNFNGTLANLTFVGATGVLSNNATTKTISLVTATPLRNPTNIVWVGNAVNNIWDTTTTTNWLNNGSLDFFVPSDNVRFDSTGAINPFVNIPGSVSPASVTVDTAANYTFLGVGTIGGAGGITKTNSGTLTVMTTNSYTGQTIVSGGVLEVTNLSIGGSPSSIGSANSDPTNLIITDSVLRYIGANNGSSDRGATLGDLGATIDMPNSAVTLTMGGVISGAALTKTGPGTLTLNGTSTFTNATVQNGTLAIQSANGGGNGVISNQNNTTLRVIGALTVANALDFEGTVFVDLNNTGGNAALDGAWSGSGTAIITNQNNAAGRTFTIGGNGALGGNLTNFSGTIECGNSPQIIRFNDGGATGSGPNFGSSNMTLDLGTSTAIFVTRNGGTTINIGALMGGANTTLSGRGGNGGAGTVTYSIGGKGLSTQFDGSITNGGGNDQTAITLVGGTLRLTGATNIYTGATTVSGGTLQVDGVISNSAVTVAGGGGGVLTGNGIIGGTTEVGFNSYFKPGDGIGVLAISNSLILDFGCSNIFELNAALGTNSSVAGLVGVTYGGDLTVNNIAGTFSAGQTFTLFSNSGNFNGAFGSTNLPALPAGFSWDTSQLSVNGSIKVIGPVAPPKFTSVSQSAGNIIISGSNGPTTGNYAVLISSNLLLPLSNWTALSTNAFNPDGTFNITNPIDKTIRRQFYDIQVVP
jgi:autotransporter-associated beta strand protein